jgi:hypothetical protein
MEVSAAAEELVEDVEWVAASSSSSGSSLFVLFHAFRAVAVVDASQVLVGQHLVGFGDFDEFLRGRVVVGVLVRMVLFGEATVGLFEVSF